MILRRLRPTSVATLLFLASVLNWPRSRFGRELLPCRHGGFGILGLVPEIEGILQGVLVVFIDRCHERVQPDDPVQKAADDRYVAAAEAVVLNMPRLVWPTTSDEVVVAQLTMLLAAFIRFLSSLRDGDAFAVPVGIAIFDLLEQVLHFEQSEGGFCFAVQLSERILRLS
ncbi:MAG: hypothetical protein D1H97_19290 [Paracoccus sp. BP8]|nr:MAG: hypothetical protein D1H97_19290 [Paracoccus sp. BP8]